MKWCGLLLVVLFGGCATVSETGRKQLILLSPGEEAQLGVTSFNEMKKEVPISKDPAANALLQRVGQRIAAVSSLTNAQWEFVVFESPEPNAFCLPGGKVGIYTGILPITKDEAGLATVVGHEVAHAAARHGAERLSNQMLLQTGGQVLGSAVSAADPRWQTAAGAVYGLGANLGYALPHSRAQESEADRIGLLYMARAGYEPDAAVGFWERFAEVNRKSGSGTPWFLRTHPLDETRIKRIKEWLPEARREYRR
ncbi:MAG: M48 family metallopeptidase [Verrucomicrobia subdivision 3 bacterium]|nr:M48 family metallopeptidase [Limisphaerales bacterium]